MSECAVVRAEDCYAFMLWERAAFDTGWWENVEVFLRGQHSGQWFRWNVPVQVVANPIWRRGRLFFRCPGCTKRATRLYVPDAGQQPRCRQCYGLNYASQSWNYKGGSGLSWDIGSPRAVCHSATDDARRERGRAARARHAARQALLTAGSPTPLA